MNTLEKKVVERTLDCLLAAHYELGVVDSVLPRLPSKSAVLDAMEGLDEVTLQAIPPSGRRYFIFFVFGNSPWEVINDSSPALDSLLAPVILYCDELEKEVNPI